MATFTEPDILSQDIANKVYDFDSDVFRLVFSSAAPSLTTTFLLSNVSQITTGGGYTQMVDGANAFTGATTTLTFARSGQTTTVSGTQVVFTATGAVAAFRYVYWIDDTPTTPLNPVVGWIDHGSSITMANTDTYTVPAGALFTIN
jgi:NADPH-dependent curcumin reductase CurA